MHAPHLLHNEPPSHSALNRHNARMPESRSTEPQRNQEHTDPHIVAGWRHPADLEPPLLPDGKRDFTKLAGLLLQPLAALGKRAYARPVWHCTMRAAPEDRTLSDGEWAAIAHDVLHRTG